MKRAAEREQKELLEGALRREEGVAEEEEQTEEGEIPAALQQQGLSSRLHDVWQCDQAVCV